MSKYVAFQFIPPDDKRITKLVKVFEVRSNNQIGVIKWYSSWRRYCFFPFGATLYDSQCLKDIIDFLDKLMEDRKKAG